MISRAMVKSILYKYLSGELTKEQVSDWAYEKLVEEQYEFEDELVSEVLYNLVSFHNVGLIFAKYRPSQEKLEYLHAWLEGSTMCNWNQYKELYQSFTANLN